MFANKRLAKSMNKTTKMLYVQENQNSGLISNKNFMFFFLSRQKFVILLQMHNKKNVYLPSKGYSDDLPKSVEVEFVDRFPGLS